jgi:hypothetical protein
VYRDSKTGQFTPKENVTRRPATTETETRPVRRSGKTKK